MDISYYISVVMDMAIAVGFIYNESINQSINKEI